MDVRQLQQRVDRWLEILEATMTETHKYVGEKFVQKARRSVTATIYSRQVYDKNGQPRKRHPWELTGNLRSSIGYTLIARGTKLQNFQGEGTEGIKAGGEVSSKLATDAGGNISIAMVAGMNYAAAVESRGYDVISNSIQEIKPMLDKRVTDVLKAAISKL